MNEATIKSPVNLSSSHNEVPAKQKDEQNFLKPLLRIGHTYFEFHTDSYGILVLRLAINGDIQIVVLVKDYVDHL